MSKSPHHEPSCTSPRAAGDLHPAVRGYVQHVEAVLDKHAAGTLTTHELAPAMAEGMRPLVATKDVLSLEQRVGCDTGYCRHLLYADPAGRFTLLALIWQPGQSSPIHGHTSWCAVGVHRGTPSEVHYDIAEPSSGANTCTELHEDTYGPGDVCFSREGWDDAHRVHNASADDVITFHIYGKDLADHPAAINLLLDEVA